MSPSDLPTPARPTPDRPPADERSAYEQLARRRIAAWREQPPPLVARVSGRAAGPVGRGARRLLPSRWLTRAFAGLDRAAERLADRDGVLKMAGVDDLAVLHRGPLARCDQLADRVSDRATLLAGSGGAVFGVVGAPGLIAELPWLLVQGLRLVRRIAACYGEDCTSELALAVLGAASAGSVADKEAALALLDDPALIAALDPERSSLERAAERQLAKRAATAGLQGFAARYSARAAAGGLPGIGAVVGAGLSAFYLQEVAEAARFTFAQRWLDAQAGRRSGS